MRAGLADIDHGQSLPMMRLNLVRSRRFAGNRWRISCDHAPPPAAATADEDAARSPGPATEGSSAAHLPAGRATTASVGCDAWREFGAGGAASSLTGCMALLLRDLPGADGTSVPA